VSAANEARERSEPASGERVSVWGSEGRSPSDENEKLGAKHKVLIIPECGHNDRCVYTTDEVLRVIFPRE
jgi:hypothetical protein